jgi:hypothetical protein
MTETKPAINFSLEAAVKYMMETHQHSRKINDLGAVSTSNQPQP